MDPIDPIVPSQPDLPPVTALARVAATARDGRGGGREAPGRHRRRADDAAEEAVQVSVDGVEPERAPAPEPRPRIDLLA